MDIMIEYFDDQVGNDISMENFVSVGDKIKFQESEELFRLRNLPIDEIARELKIQSS
jgi:hypothetical protein